MAKQTIIAEIISSFLSKINSNFTELYSQTPPDADRALSHTYIPEGNEVPTGVLVPGTPTKYQLPVTIRKINNFEIKEISGQPGVFALHYTGSRPITAKLGATTSLITSANNVTVKLMMYKNGAEAVASAIKRKIGTGADLGAMTLTTTIEMAQNDYFDVYVESDIASTITFLLTNIVITEIPG